MACWMSSNSNMKFTRCTHDRMSHQLELYKCNSYVDSWGEPARGGRACLFEVRFLIELLYSITWSVCVFITDKPTMVVILICLIFIVKYVKYITPETSGGRLSKHVNQYYRWKLKLPMTVSTKHSKNLALILGNVATELAKISESRFF